MDVLLNKLFQAPKNFHTFARGIHKINKIDMNLLDFLLPVRNVYTNTNSKNLRKETYRFTVLESTWERDNV
ncbi:hypothetical protein LTR28_005092 [Elasticomyces elasticus]|nr:hypothetical protein LTR28_005092 [Elasticomyces elasticus]